ncbi:hypothetical protein NDU88_003927 [Pleurodeles waltl]|uniref:Uncharacterized protein n=1 Tax=Pleurodeles waltl TaxID=8319 RepID=A0AAV7TQF5_PLEWA|nr:hypothetical protein NDU88_003927 [Pleurodeles waltl]
MAIPSELYWLPEKENTNQVKDKSKAGTQTTTMRDFYFQEDDTVSTLLLDAVQWRRDLGQQEVRYKEEGKRAEAAHTEYEEDREIKEIRGSNTRIVPNAENQQPEREQDDQCGKGD